MKRFYENATSCGRLPDFGSDKSILMHKLGLVNQSFLRNEVISKTLYLCKDVETFGSGLRKIYSLCDSANIDISYVDTEADFTMEFSRIDRNNMPEDGMINGTITELESEVLEFLRKNKNATIPELLIIVGSQSGQ